MNIQNAKTADYIYMGGWMSVIIWESWTAYSMWAILISALITEADIIVEEMGTVMMQDQPFRNYLLECTA